MPRVARAEHYRRHQQLRDIFYDPDLRSLFSLVSTDGQLELYDYYCPTEALGIEDFELRQQRLAVENSSLVHRAGKHYRVISDALEAIRAEEAGENTGEVVRRVVSQMSRDYPSSAVVKRDGLSLTITMKPVDASLLARMVVDTAINGINTSPRSGLAGRRNSRR